MMYLILKTIQYLSYYMSPIDLRKLYVKFDITPIIRKQNIFVEEKITKMGEFYFFDQDSLPNGDKTSKVKIQFF